MINEKANVAKKTLFVVSDYLPNSSGGTLRVEKNIKYLSKEGLVCKVFTQELNGVGKYDIINNVEVFRTNTYNLGKYYVKIKSLFKSHRKPLNKQNSDINICSGRLADKFFVPDIDMIWALLCSYKLSCIIKKTGIQIVYSSSPSASNHFIVYLSKRIWCTKFTWITEFRDPWITNPFRLKKSALLEYLDQKLENAVITNSDTIVVTSVKYKEDFLKRYKFLENYKIKYAPNGYDSEDFSFISNIIKRKNKKYTILSAGGYYDKRSLLPFIKAFELAINEHPDLENKVHFIHYGSIDIASKNYLQFNNIKGIEILGNISHDKCLEEMYHADCLLLIPGPGDGTMPGKTYEYLASGNPILILADDGPAKTLIEELKAGIVNKLDDIDRLKSLIINFETELNISIDREILQASISKYDRKNIANDIFNIIQIQK